MVEGYNTTSTSTSNNNKNNSNNNNITLSSYIYDQCSIFTYANITVETKLHVADTIEPYINGYDSYITFKGDTHQAHLPALTNWNGTTGLRKGYSLLMWIRPRLAFVQVSEEEDATTTINDSNNKTSTNENDNNSQKMDDSSSNSKRTEPMQRVLYRFSTSMVNSLGNGICVSCSQWKAVPVEKDDDDDDDTDDNSCNEHVPQRKQRKMQLETMLTAYTLPHYKSNQVPPAGFRAHYVQQPLILIENEWQLLGFNHTNPYLKPAVWSVTVNGRLMGSDNLPYPTLPEHHHINSMEYCSIFHNITSSGAIMTIQSSSTTATTSTSTSGTTDSQKTASQLQEESRIAVSSIESDTSSSSSQYHKTIDLMIDLVAIALYAEKSIPYACLAVAADAGPALALQKGGRILPTLPPVANWTKGASLEGPKVGIPLAVHSSALNLQQLSSAPHLLFCCSAMSSRILGSTADENNTRLVCSMALQPGSTSNTPRVGLVQPAAPVRIPEDELPCLYVVGNVRLYHAVSEYILHTPDLVGDVLSTNLRNNSMLMSAALIDQELLSHLIQPFFLALCPPGKIFDRQHNLYKASLIHLHDLYSNDAVYAARLLRLFAVALRTGGGRAQEEVLQSGLIHVVASSLRLGLLRAIKLKLFQNKIETIDEFIQRVTKYYPDEINIAPPQHGMGNSPSYIPSTVTIACCDLIDTCCGPPKNFLETLSPHFQIKRTSDLALTAIFGLALDLDLWAGYPNAAVVILNSVTRRYSPYCITSGFVLRSQLSVQHFMDMTRVHFEEKVYTEDSPAPKQLETTAIHLSKIVQAMLLSSLSNTRSVSQSETDIAACVTVLSDCPLGTIGAHVILNAIASILRWCDVFPINANVKQPKIPHSHAAQERDKRQVSSRMGQNILVAQFHDVIAPMILSRMVFSSERNQSTKISNSTEECENKNVCDSDSVCWQNHWRLSLMIFLWVASFAGPAGGIASKTCGNLLMAAGHAGTLEDVLDRCDKGYISNLLVPPPSASLEASRISGEDLSYTDLLGERLEIIIPFLPGLVAAILSRFQITKVGIQRNSNSPSVRVLLDIFTSVGGSFHRVLGSIIHLFGPSAVDGTVTKPVSVSKAIKAAKVYAHHLVATAYFIEDYIITSDLTKSEQKIPEISPLFYVASATKNDDWLHSSRVYDQILLNNQPFEFPMVSDEKVDDMIVMLRSCQDSMLYTASGLILSSMDVGGSGAAIPLWETILLTLQQARSLPENNLSNKEGQAPNKEKLSASTAINPDGTLKLEIGNDLISVAMTTVVTQIMSQIFTNIVRRCSPHEVLSYELSSSLAYLCSWIESTRLLSVSEQQTKLTEHQVVLLSTILDIMSFGRESMGWCQVLPQETLEKDMETPESKIYLPILRPLLLVAIQVLEYVPPSIEVTILNSPEPRKENFLQVIVVELNLTLTSAIVGLAFSGARETALRAMSTFRKLLRKYETSKDETSAKLFSDLLVKIAEELRVRYECERRLREKALLNPYDSSGDDTAKKQSIQVSQAVERLILGKPFFENKNKAAKGSNENLNLLGRDDGVSDDFVSFNEPGVSLDNSNSKNKLGYEFLNGMGAALELWKESSDNNSNAHTTDSLLPLLNPFLDAWDTTTNEMGNTNGAHIKADSASVDARGKADAGVDVASEAMSTFFEFLATEKLRLKEVSNRFLPSYRYSRMSFADRFCWSRFMESTSFEAGDDWDRGVGDGNRDIRSRIPTLPCFPQFRRHLPRYLDNGHTQNGVPVPFTSDTDAARVPLAPGELGALTKSLIETGHLEIVDITKKQVEDEEEPDPSLPTTFVSTLGHEDDIFSDIGGQSREELPQKSETVSGGEAVGDDAKTDDLDGQDDEIGMLPTDLGGKFLHNITTSSFATPPDNASSSLSLLHSAAATLIEEHIENCVNVKAEGNRQCTLLLTASHLILEYDGNLDGFFEGEILARQEEADRQKMMEEIGSVKDKDPEEVLNQRSDRRHREFAALRSKSIRWNLTEVSHVYLRRYRLRDTAIELFFIPTGSTSFGGFGFFSPSSSLFLDFGPGYEGITRRDDAAFAIMRRSPSQAIKQWPDRSDLFLHEQLNRLTLGWAEGRISNFDYLLHLNMLAGRSYNDICQYPVFPWVLSDYTSTEIPDLSNKSNFRDLSKPVGALNEARLQDFLERFRTFADPSIPPFMYGSHYSTSAGVVLHFLVRQHPFAGLHRQLQGGHFDVADRLFSSIPRTWGMCTGSSAGEVKELTPEWYCNPSFLRNANKFKLGTSQDGEVIDDVILPPWAKGSPERFVEVMRAALESDICSEMLSSWIDLIFGKKQQGPAAIDANNVFFYLTYYGTVDVASIEDESLRHATELQIAHFGQCPMQLFKRLHVRRLPRYYYEISLYQVLRSYSQTMKPSIMNEATKGVDMTSTLLETNKIHSLFGDPLYLPFFSAPLSSWVHLDAPPPGPHSPLVAVRFAGVDRCLAVDAKGVFHCFRWAWRAEESNHEPSEKIAQYFDRGCFIAQRELPRFKVLPRLVHAPQHEHAVVAISKTLFAGRTVLLVLSDGDGCGSLAMQLVDPAKGEIRGEVLVPQVHSGRITCITTDPIGSAAGHGGVGGELCLAGSSDGTASLWRFMSSHYLPLRPRLKFRGHGGKKIVGVALCAPLHVAVTLSVDRCCVHSVGNGSMIRSFGPPQDTIDLQGGNELQTITRFADSPAIAVSVQGYIIVVCETTIKSSDRADRSIFTMHLFSVEGASLGSKPLETWRGSPRKMYCIPDGSAVLICCGRGVTIHRVSVCQPLEYLDEFQVTESDELDHENSMQAAWDVDFGPSLHRPVVAAAACCNGVLRLHALAGISAWSERQNKGGLSHTVGNALATPARRINQAVRGGLDFGRQIAGMGRDLSQEVSTDVKEKGVGGFLGGIFRKK